MIIAGGDPANDRENYMVKDSDGCMMIDKAVIDANPNRYYYLGTARINSVIIHTYQFFPIE